MSSINRQSYKILEGGDPEEEPFLTSSSMQRRPLLHGVSKASIAIWISSFMFCVLSLCMQLLPRHGPPASAGVSRVDNPYINSPVQDAVEYEDVQFDNAFWKPSPYKGKPNSELEQRWRDLWFYPTFDLPVEYLDGLNKSRGERWVHTPKGGLAAGLEVFHSLHCLDMIRQYTWKGYYDYSDHLEFQDAPEFVRSHVDHCIEALRIRIMCTGDVTPFLHRYDEETELGWTPDFNTQHQCVKYEKIQEWARENEVRPPARHR